MINDPWNWTEKEQQQTQIVAPLSNTITPIIASNEQGNPTQVIPLQPTPEELQNQRDMQQLRGIGIDKGIHSGGNYLSKKMQPPLATPAPVVEQSVLASYPTVATSASGLAGVGSQTIAPMAVEASAAPLAAAGTEAGLATTLASNPVGWGIGALMLAKSMKWI